MSKELTDAIVGMREDEALGLVKSMLDGGTDPEEVLDEAKEAMTELGRRFECEEAFIPELIMGGEIMQAIAAELKPHLAGKSEAEKRGTVVIATVHGDIHDIGKDIVVHDARHQRLRGPRPGRRRTDRGRGRGDPRAPAARSSASPASSPCPSTR